MERLANSSARAPQFVECYKLWRLMRVKNTDINTAFVNGVFCSIVGVSASITSMLSPTVRPRASTSKTLTVYICSSLDMNYLYLSSARRVLRFLVRIPQRPCQLGPPTETAVHAPQVSAAANTGRVLTALLATIPSVVVLHASSLPTTAHRRRKQPSRECMHGHYHGPTINEHSTLRT